MRKVLTLLAILSDEDIDWMVAKGSHRAVATGQAIIVEDESLDYLFVVLEGRLAVSIAGKQIEIVGPGEVLGEISLLDSRPPTATVAAMQSSAVLSLPRSDLNERLEQLPAFAGRFYKVLSVVLAQRLRRTVMSYGSEEQEAVLGYSDELDPELMKMLTLAGARFNFILDRLRDE